MPDVHCTLELQTTLQLHSSFSIAATGPHSSAVSATRLDSHDERQHVSRTEPPDSVEEGGTADEGTTFEMEMGDFGLQTSTTVILKNLHPDRGLVQVKGHVL